MQYNPTLALFLAAVLLFASCKKADSPAIPEGKDLDLTATELQKVAAENAFSAKLLQAVVGGNTKPDNVFISPLSVGFAFGMTANGAGGETSTAIHNTMQFNNFTEEQVNAYYKKLITGLPLVDPATTLKVANAIWYDQQFSVVPQFLETNSNYYQAKVQKADFGAAATLNDINGWVSQQTNNKIPKIIEQIPPYAAMYLINAVYFKSAWKQKFDPAKTTKKTFTTNQGTTVQTDFMVSDKITIKAATDADATVYEIPYLNDKFSMEVISPSAGRTLPQLAAALDGAKLQNWPGKLQPTTVYLNMPKFKFSFGASLKPTLIDMGMGNAFSNQANFSRLAATGSVTITDVRHKGYVDVNEEGTEAAAATAVEIGVTSVLHPTITLDRPFIFAIREVKTGLILFMGVMNNPLLTGNE